MGQRLGFLNLQDLEEEFDLMDLREVVKNFTIPEGHEATYKCKPGQSPFANYDVKELIILTDPKNLKFVGCNKDQKNEVISKALKSMMGSKYSAQWKKLAAYKQKMLL